ncbi:hypothetical protein GOBAR_AA06282 [Gossypium barbadense]|uniref:Piwi domain-containing protein n=1 Tax=Gossypium barbadense TaxID=3634 RepID=A0A2P5YFC2_GOSBA|nr:hypothetical protein GOBAR_AA06282 [Gossypium barbadense]
MTETGKNWHKKLPPTLYAYAGANTLNSSCFKVSDKMDDGIMKESLLDFYTSSGKRKPDQIIIFRDELLRLASSLTRSGTLKIVVIVVRKSIIPSFFSRDLLTMCYMVLLLATKYAIQRTMVFYLGAHAGMIGITRQIHYHVLLDQAGFSADDLQEFVHYLSYMYQRSTTAIFVVAPICYAHLVASQLGAIYED